MRMTTSLKKLLGIQHLLVTGSAVEDGALVIEVRPSWRAPRCSGCKKRRHDSDRPAVRPDHAGRERKNAATLTHTEAVVATDTLPSSRRPYPMLL